MNLSSLKEKGAVKLEETIKSIKGVAEEIKQSYHRGTLKEDTYQVAERMRSDIREQLPKKINTFKKILRDPNKELNKFFHKMSSQKTQEPKKEEHSEKES